MVVNVGFVGTGTSTATVEPGGTSSACCRSMKRPATIMTIATTANRPTEVNDLPMTSRSKNSHTPRTETTDNNATQKINPNAAVSCILCMCMCNKLSIDPPP